MFGSIRQRIYCLAVLIGIITSMTIFELPFISIISDQSAIGNPNHIPMESHFNFTAKSNNSLLHKLYYDAISELKNGSGQQITIKLDINGDEVIYDDDRGVIFGNPLMIPECHQSLRL